LPVGNDYADDGWERSARMGVGPRWRVRFGGPWGLASTNETMDTALVGLGTYSGSGFAPAGPDFGDHDRRRRAVASRAA